MPGLIIENRYNIKRNTAALEPVAAAAAAVAAAVAVAGAVILAVANDAIIAGNILISYLQFWLSNYRQN